MPPALKWILKNFFFKLEMHFLLQTCRNYLKYNFYPSAQVSMEKKLHVATISNQAGALFDSLMSSGRNHFKKKKKRRWGVVHFKRSRETRASRAERRHGSDI